MPAVILVICFSIGILLERHLTISQHFLLPLLIVSLAVVVLLPIQKGNKRIKSIIVLAGLTAGGYLHAYFQNQYRLENFIHHSFLNQKLEYNSIIDHITHSETYTNLRIRLKEVHLKDGHVIRLNSQNALLKIKRSAQIPHLIPGTMLHHRTSFKALDLTGDPNDYIDYLHRQGIDLMGYARASDIDIIPYHHHPLTYIRYVLRPKALAIIDSHCKDHNANPILKALLLGYKADLSSDVKEDFIDSGTMHILAVSGLHTGIIGYLLFLVSQLIFFWTKSNSVLRLVLISGGLVFFAEISGGAPPVWRASIMLIIYLISRKTSNYSSPLNLVACAAIILLIYDHNYLFDLSFQLSFSAVLGILLIYPILESLYYPSSKIGKYLCGIVYMGIAAQISLLPLSFYYFNQVSLLSPLTSIVSITLALPTVCFGCLLLLSDIVVPSLSTYISSLLEGMIFIMHQTSALMSDVSVAIIEHIYIDRFEALILSLGILLIVLAYHRRSFRLLHLSYALLLFQSGLHLYYKIDNSNKIAIIHNQDEVLTEIHIGTQSIVINDQETIDFNIKKERRANRITSFTNYTEL